MNRAVRLALRLLFATTLLAVPTLLPAVPAAVAATIPRVAGITAQATSASKATVSWSAAESTSSYQVKAGKITKTTPNLSLTIAAKASTPIRVRAISQSGTKGPWSKAVYMAPSAPRALRVSAVNESRAKIRWNKTTGATAYEVDLGGVIRTTRAASIQSTLFAGEVVRVRAKGRGGYGAWGNEVVKGAASQSEMASLKAQLESYNLFLLDVRAEIAQLDSDRKILDYQLGVAKQYNDELRASKLVASIAQNDADRAAAISRQNDYQHEVSVLQRAIAAS